MIAIEPLQGIPEVRPGDDLGALLSAAVAQTGRPLGETDVVVVTQKIVSKSEDRFVCLDEVAPGETARSLAAQVLKDPRLVELVLSESSAVVRAAPHVLITRHRLGMVMANAGIDASN
ncbi:MAG: coenzyme F420-0:L-glutamate ligase, partial [Brevundimonas sp.]